MSPTTPIPPWPAPIAVSPKTAAESAKGLVYVDGYKAEFGAEHMASNKNITTTIIKSVFVSIVVFSSIYCGLMRWNSYMDRDWRDIIAVSRPYQGSEKIFYPPLLQAPRRRGSAGRRRAAPKIRGLGKIGIMRGHSGYQFRFVDCNLPYQF
jgi:hypothetical protein